MSRHLQTGRRGEDLAAEFLASSGYRILARNYRFQRAEVDIVAFLPGDSTGDAGELVFVEVKTRTGTGFGHPEEAVSAGKQRNIVRVARAWLRENRLEGERCRFDVIGILMKRVGDSDVHHLENAFWSR